MVDSSRIRQRHHEIVQCLKARINKKKEEIDETMKECAELHHSGEWAEEEAAALHLWELEGELRSLQEELEAALPARKIVRSN